AAHGCAPFSQQAYDFAVAAAAAKSRLWDFQKEVGYNREDATMRAHHRRQPGKISQDLFPGSKSKVPRQTATGFSAGVRYRAQIALDDRARLENIFDRHAPRAIDT